VRRATRGLAAAAAAVVVAMCGRGVGAVPAEDQLRPPPGATVSVFASDLPDARFMRFTPKGDLLLSQPRSGRVVLLEADRNGDGRSDGRREVLTGLNRPQGLDLHEGWLYVAETDAVGRVRFDPETGKSSGSFERLAKIPGGGGHWTRTLRFGPDDWMYVSIGSTCNVCIEKDARRAAIVRFHADGSGEEIYATGLRNAVGFDWRSPDGQMYATDNGRDLLGDDFPPCELDKVVKGGFYGWPIANGNRVPDPDFGKGQEARIAASIPPVHGFRAHNAPLGITFLRGDAVPAEYRGAAIAALHGSWNRTHKDGYKVVSLHWGSDDQVTEKDFLTGFLRPNEEVIGRPVDVAEGPDGSIYVSDDEAGAVYRVQWQATPPRSRTPPPPAVKPGSAAARPGSAPLAQDAIARGRALWDANGCAKCHDPKAKVPGMVTKRLEGLTKRYDVGSLSEYLKAPKPPMPVFDLSDQQRADLAAFLLSEHP
jgi:glucose/arabinose dehydrogenase